MTFTDRLHRFPGAKAMFLPALFISSVCLAADPTSRPPFEKAVQPFLAKNCYGCHNSKLSSGKLNLESYKTAAAIAQDRDRWERVLQRIETGEMPPKGAPRPSDADLKTVTAWITK